MASKKYHNSSMGRILRNYYDSSDRVHLRLGQFFVNTYYSGVWSELYHTEDDAKAVAMINQWLIDNGKVDRMPKTI